MKEQRREEKGITLVALVVTIIVLIILAGVTLNIVLDNDGIINKAKQATEDYENSQKEEEELLAEIEKNMGIIEKVTDSNPGELEVDENDSNLLYINSIEDLVGLSNKVNNGETFVGKTIKLNYHLDFNSDKSYVDASQKTNLTTGEGFIPIGNDVTEIKDGTGYTLDIEGKYFSGTFDGNGYTIYNLYQNLSNNMVGGLFGTTYNATIKNVKLTGAVTCTQNEPQMLYVGGLIGYQYSGTTTDCVADVEVTGKNSQNSESFIGGIIGDLAPLYTETETKKGANVLNCINRGKVIAKTENFSENVTRKRVYVGGNVGAAFANATLENLENQGDIEFENEMPVSRICIGGCVGQINRQKKMSNTVNEGNIQQNGDATEYIRIGGIAGIIGTTGTTEYPKETKNLFNSGNINSVIGNLITPELAIGGIAGSIVETNLYNAGNVGSITLENGNTNAQRIAGIAGRSTNDSIINNVYNLGKFNISNNQVTGIVYIMPSGGSLINAYYNNDGVNRGTATTTGITDKSISKTESEMKSQDFVDLLNNPSEEITGIEGLLEWKLGTEKYPVLSANNIT